MPSLCNVQRFTGERAWFFQAYIQMLHSRLRYWEHKDPLHPLDTGVPASITHGMTATEIAVMSEEKEVGSGWSRCQEP